MANEVVFSKLHGSFIIQVRVDDEELAKAIKEEVEATIWSYESLKELDVE